MKLYTTITSEKGKPATKGGNSQIVINLTIDPVKRKEIGNLVLRYDEISGYSVNYFPINANCQSQKINCGKVLLFEEKSEQLKAKEYQNNLNCERIQHFGEQHPLFKSKEMREWRKQKKAEK